MLQVRSRDADEHELGSQDQRARAVKVEIETRKNRASDEDGYFSSDLFRHQNPDIDVPAAEWFAERLQEAKKLQNEVDDLQGVEDSFKGFEDLQVLGRQPTAQGYGGVSAVRLSDELVKSAAWDEFRSNGLKNMTFNQEGRPQDAV